MKPATTLSSLVVLLLVATTAPNPVRAAEVRVESRMPYKQGTALSDAERQRCRLDLYLPVGVRDYPTLVWFHGGGLKGGERDGRETVAIARRLASAGVAVAAASYRLSPQSTYPAYIEDAAAAVAWTLGHIRERGGDERRVFVGGHSAGGYLAFMVGMDPRYLARHGVALESIAGLIPVSGQTMTHYTVREERGIGRYTIIADEAAPVFHCRAETPPMLVLYADHDMVARAAENEYLVEILKGTGNKGISGLLVRDRDHGSIASKIADEGDPAQTAILRFIRP